MRWERKKLEKRQQMVIQSGRADLVLRRQVFANSGGVRGPRCGSGLHQQQRDWWFRGSPRPSFTSIRVPRNERGLKSTQYGVFSVVSFRCDVSRWGNQPSRKFRPNHRRPIVQYSHRSPEPHGSQSSRKTQSVIELKIEIFQSVSFLGRTIWVKVLSQPNRNSGDVQSPWVHILSFPSRRRAKGLYPVKILNQQRQNQEFLHPFGPKILSQQNQSQRFYPVQDPFPADTAAVPRVQQIRGFISCPILSQQKQEFLHPFGPKILSHQKQSQEFSHPVGPMILSRQKQSQEFSHPVGPRSFSPEVEPGVFTSSWSKILSEQMQRRCCGPFTEPHWFPHPVGPG